MLEATAGVLVLKVTLAAALGLLAVRVSNRGAASVRHAILALTFAAFAAIPIVAFLVPRYAHDSWLGLDLPLDAAAGDEHRPAVDGGVRYLRPPHRSTDCGSATSRRAGVRSPRLPAARREDDDRPMVRYVLGSPAVRRRSVRADRQSTAKKSAQAERHRPRPLLRWT